MPFKDSRARAEYRRRYQRETAARRKREWIKEHGPCVRCKSTERLQVDHVDPKAKVTHRVWLWARERRELELKKCQVLCWRCHREKTSREATGRRRPNLGKVLHPVHAEVPNA